MQKRRKILYVITKSVWGGAQRYVFDLATNFPGDRLDVAVITGGNGPLVEKLEQAGIRTIVLPTLQESGALFRALFSFINFRALWQLLRIFREEKPDIIHLNSSKIGGLGAIAAFIYKLDTCHMSHVTIFTVHGWGFKEDRPLISRAVIFFFSWLSTLFQDKIILINTADFSTAQKFISKKKLMLIFNGIGPIEFLPKSEACAFFARKINREVPEDTILIGTNAELTPNKGLKYLTSALSRSDLGIYQGQTLIIGEGEGREKLQNQIKKFDLQEKVFLVGFIPDAPRYLRAFDIFILPSLKEGLPYTIMEAMAAGLAVVATNVGGIPDLIEQGKSGLLVPPKNSEALSRAIEELLQDPEKRALLGQAAKTAVKTKFALRDMIEKTIALYSIPR